MAISGSTFRLKRLQFFIKIQYIFFFIQNYSKYICGLSRRPSEVKQAAAEEEDTEDNIQQINEFH